MTDYTINNTDHDVYATDHVDNRQGGLGDVPAVMYDHYHVTQELIDDFAKAMLRLEGLLYVVYGSVPNWGKAYGNTYNNAQSPAITPRLDGGQAPGVGSPSPANRNYQKDWWEQRNPRCLWPDMNCGVPIWDYICSSCSGYNGYREPGFAQYLATGHACPTSGLARQKTAGGLGSQGINFGEIRGPQVPVRSRSGDPKLQYAMAYHNNAVFPFGSVERDHSDMTHALQPGDPSRRDEVEIRWQKPAGVNISGNPTLRYQVEGSSAKSLPMTQSGGWYRATIPGDEGGDTDVHDKKVEWYIQVSVVTGESTQTVYEPTTASNGTPSSHMSVREGLDLTNASYDRIGGTDKLGAVRSDWRYSFVVFRHYLGPFACGLPELLADHLGSPYNDWDDDALDRNDPDHSSYTGPFGEGNPRPDPGNLVKGTERWKFDSLQDINPDMINMARFALDQIGKVCQHNPRDRDTPLSAQLGEELLCCFDLWINWRWSGSAPPWQYAGSGKTPQSTIPFRPLHNRPDHDYPGVVEERHAWRGHGWMEFDGKQGSRVLGFPFENDPLGMPTVAEKGSENWEIAREYGGDQSWDSYPDRLDAGFWYPSSDFDPILCEFSDGKTAKWYSYGPGLKSGDVISATHLYEIIKAVEYLIDDNGCWVTTRVTSKPRQFTSYPDNLFGLKCNERVDIDDGVKDFSEICGDGDCCGAETCADASECARPANSLDCVDNYGNPTNRYCERWEEGDINCGASYFASGDSDLRGPDGYTYARCTTTNSLPWYLGVGFCYGWGHNLYPEGYNTREIKNDYNNWVRTGFSVYYCGPNVASFGPGGPSEQGWYGGTNNSGRDLKHGNGISAKVSGRANAKNCHIPGILNNFPSYGNSFDTSEGVIYCGYSEAGVSRPKVGFNGVDGVQWLPPLAPWITENIVFCSPGSYARPSCPVPDLPGMGDMSYPDQDGETYPACGEWSDFPNADRPYYCKAPYSDPYPDSWAGLSDGYCCDTGNLQLPNCMGDTAYVAVDMRTYNGVPRLTDYLDSKDGSQGGDGGDLYFVDICTSVSDCRDKTGVSREPYEDRIPWSACPCNTQFESWEPDAECVFENTCCGLGGCCNSGPGTDCYC